MVSISGFGVDYEIPLSKAQGIKMAGRELKVGYEVDVASHTVNGLKVRLAVQNISGRYCLASTQPKSEWERLFMFNVEAKAFWR